MSNVIKENKKTKGNKKLKGLEIDVNQPKYDAEGELVNEEEEEEYDPEVADNL